jgi:hypothetical protein
MIHCGILDDLIKLVKIMANWRFGGVISALASHSSTGGVSRSS